MADAENKSTLRSNIALIGHIQHGKSTINNLLAIPPHESPRANGSRTVRIGISTVNSPFNENALHQFTLIDTPGHPELFGEVKSALRLADGAILIVDCHEGVRPPAEWAVRHSVLLGLRLVLFINKLDKTVLETSWTPKQVSVGTHQLIFTFC